MPSVKEIFNLAVTPIPRKKEHVLDVKEHRLLCELSVDKIRFYYEVSQERIIVNEVNYKGKVLVGYGKNNHKFGNKKNWSNQQKFINWLKKIFRR